MAKRRGKEVQHKWMTTTLRWYLQDIRTDNGEKHVDRMVYLSYESCDCPDFVKPGNYQMGTKGYKTIQKHPYKDCFGGAYKHGMRALLMYNIISPTTSSPFGTIPAMFREGEEELTDEQFHKLVGDTKPHDIEYDVFD